MRSHKKSLGRSLKHCRMLLRREALSWMFRLWSSRSSDDIPESTEIINYGTTLRIGTLRCFAAFRHQSRLLHRSIRTAKSSKLHAVLESITPDTPAATIQKIPASIQGTIQQAPPRVSTTSMHQRCARTTLQHFSCSSGSLDRILWRYGRRYSS